MDSDSAFSSRILLPPDSSWKSEFFRVIRSRIPKGFLSLLLISELTHSPILEGMPQLSIYELTATALEPEQVSTSKKNLISIVQSSNILQPSHGFIPIVYYEATVLNIGIPQDDETGYHTYDSKSLMLDYALD